MQKTAIVSQDSHAPWKKIDAIRAKFAYVGSGNSSWGYKVKGQPSSGPYEMADSGSDFEMGVDAEVHGSDHGELSAQGLDVY